MVFSNSLCKSSVLNVCQVNCKASQGVTCKFLLHHSWNAVGEAMFETYLTCCPVQKCHRPHVGQVNVCSSTHVTWITPWALTCCQWNVQKKQGPIASSDNCFSCSQCLSCGYWKLWKHVDNSDEKHLLVTHWWKTFTGDKCSFFLLELWPVECVMAI